MRDSIDPLAPHHLRPSELLERLRKLDGDVDVADDLDMIERAVDRALGIMENTTEAQLRRIDAALARMMEGQYGFCDCCGAGIALERLEAMPATHLCAACDR